jgi:hypothetical protein
MKNLDIRFFGRGLAKQGVGPVSVILSQVVSSLPYPLGENEISRRWVLAVEVRHA